MKNGRRNAKAKRVSDVVSPRTADCGRSVSPAQYQRGEQEREFINEPRVDERAGNFTSALDQHTLKAPGLESVEHGVEIARTAVRGDDLDAFIRESFSLC